MEKIKNIKIENIFSTDIYNDVLKKIYSRKNYFFEDGRLNLPSYFCRIIGIEGDSEESYYNSLFTLEKRLNTGEYKYKRIDFRLDTKVPLDKIEKLNRIWSEIKGDENLRGSFLARNLYGANVIEKTKRDEIDILIRDAFELCIEQFIDGNSKNKNASILKNFCIKLIHWFSMYAFKMLSESKFDKDNPKILFYGSIGRDEVYFMLFLARIGFDVLYFNPSRENSHIEVKMNGVYCTLLEFPLKKEPKPFPNQDLLREVQTAAHAAQRHTENICIIDNIAFRPWQFEKYKLKSVTLKSTHGELLKILSTDSKDREGFVVIEDTIFVPNIFAKINGCHKNIEEYRTEINEICKFDFVYKISKMPFTRPSPKNFDYSTLLDRNGFIDINRVKNCCDYKMSFLKLPLQDLILDKANELIQKKYFKVNPDTHLKVRIISVILNLDFEILKLMQQFDYPFRIPKVLILHDNEVRFSTEDFITIGLLHAVGLDIIIYTPTGYSNIENFINESFYEVHSLPEIRFDLNLNKDIKSGESFIDKVKKLFFD